jgi:hypothetical protein
MFVCNVYIISNLKKVSLSSVSCILLLDYYVGSGSHICAWPGLHLTSLRPCILSYLLNLNVLTIQRNIHSWPSYLQFISPFYVTVSRPAINYQRRRFNRAYVINGNRINTMDVKYNSELISLTAETFYHVPLNPSTDLNSRDEIVSTGIAVISWKRFNFICTGIHQISTPIVLHIRIQWYPCRFGCVSRKKILKNLRQCFLIGETSDLENKNRH